MPDDDFDPSKPLDKDTEEEVQAEFRARERLRWLQEQAQKKSTPPKKRKGVFGGRD
jgi:hypothetical protein